MLPDVPTMMEAGVKDYDVALWIAYVAPAGTPDAIVGKLNRAMTDPEEPDIVETCKSRASSRTRPARGGHRAHPSETEKWRALVAKTGIKPE